MGTLGAVPIVGRSKTPVVCQHIEAATRLCVQSDASVRLREANDAENCTGRELEVWMKLCVYEV